MVSCQSGSSVETVKLIPTLSEDFDSIKALLNRQAVDWNRGDIDAFMIGYLESDALKFVGSSGMREGYTATLESYKKGYPSKADMGNLSFEFAPYDRLGSDHFLLHGRYTLQFEDERPEATGPFSLILQRIDDQWKIIYDHSC